MPNQSLIVEKSDDNFQLLIDSISMAISSARRRIATQINSAMTETYWQIGKYIVEYEQGGKAKVAYGTSTLTELSRQLTLRFGRGFSRPNLVNMRKFYLLYPNCQTCLTIYRGRILGNCSRWMMSWNVVSTSCICRTRKPCGKS